MACDHVRCAATGGPATGVIDGDANVRLLALCSIEGVSASVIAREALRAGGLSRLLDREIAERTRAGEATRRALARELPTLDRHMEHARGS